jgi:hypothetical protein
VDQDVITTGEDEIRPLVEHARLAFLSGLLMGVNNLYDFSNVTLIEKDESAFRTEKFMSGFTSVYVALKCAYYLAYEEVHLYGVDHSPAWEHYKADYPTGRTTRARMAVMEWHYQLAANIYARAGREIINHSNPSRLDAIFRRA